MDTNHRLSIAAERVCCIKTEIGKSELITPPRPIKSKSCDISYEYDLPPCPRQVRRLSMTFKHTQLNAEVDYKLPLQVYEQLCSPSRYDFIEKSSITGSSYRNQTQEKCIAPQARKECPYLQHSFTRNETRSDEDENFLVGLCFVSEELEFSDDEDDERI